MVDLIDAIITSFKKIIHIQYINLSDANTNVFIVFFTASHVSQLVNLVVIVFFAGGLALLACFAGGILRLDVG